ncbi:MAG: aspartate/glutamate racemase family protein [Pseudomonadota bacterium]
MKRLGLIGGMSWESTATYYQLLNEGIRNRMGGLHSAELLLWSFDFAEIEALQAAGDWQRATTRMIEVAKALEHASADALLICTNTMHRMAEAIEESCDIPLLHIADATAVAIKARDSHNPLLLGTRFTMEQDFYKGRLLACHGIDVRIPEMDEREVIHRIIYDELCQGEVRTDSRSAYQEIIERAVSDGADSVILGCTEIGLLIEQQGFEIPVFDTTTLHVDAALNFMLPNASPPSS